MSLVTAWSYSRWHTYDVCPLQFKLKNIDKLPEPGTPAMRRGNELHVATAQFLTGKASVLPADVMQHQSVTSLIREVQAFPDKLVEQQWGFTQQLEPTGWFGKDTWYRAVLDVALLYEDCTGEVIDWKSGRKYGENKEQMELFALSFMWKYKPTKHVTTRLVYFDSGEQELMEFPIGDKERLTKKWLAKVEPMFKDTTFAPHPGKHCARCSFSRSTGGQCAFG